MPRNSALPYIVKHVPGIWYLVYSQHVPARYSDTSLEYEAIIEPRNCTISRQHADVYMKIIWSSCGYEELQQKVENAPSSHFPSKPGPDSCFCPVYLVYEHVVLLVCVGYLSTRIDIHSYAISRMLGPSAGDKTSALIIIPARFG